VASSPDAPDSAAPKQGWFSRLKVAIGMAEAPAEAQETAVQEGFGVVSGEPPAVESVVAESAIAAVPEAVSPVAEPAAPTVEPVAAAVETAVPAIEPAIEAVAPVDPSETPVVAAPPSEPTAAMPDMETPPSEPVAAEVLETPAAPAEEAPAGSWLSRFTGRFGLGLGTPVAPAEAAAMPTGDVAAPDVHVEEAPAEIQEAVEAERKSWFSRLTERLGETRQGLISRVYRLTHGRKKIDEDMLEELEEILLTSDVGPKTTDDVLAFLRGKARDERFLPDEVVPALREYLSNRLSDGASPITAERGTLTIFLMVGVNGVGKTTTTGKIAAKFRLNDYKVLLAAADTFRAAAIDQLEIWSQRAGVDLIRHAEGGDAAAVVFDAIKAAQARSTDVLIVDTAGRLHTKHNLMEELSKIRRIVEREAPGATVETLLVLDATTGQNGLRQAEVFGQATPLTGVILTKLDGTAKGGVVFSIKETLGLPIRLLGVGEGLEDLREFDPAMFVDALFASADDTAA
jgi:fused signal recognition particle receptor